MYCYLDKFWNRYYSEYVKVSTALTESLPKRTYIIRLTYLQACNFNVDFVFF